MKSEVRHSAIVLRYELYNVLRSKWLYAYVGLLALCTLAFSRVAEDPQKVQLSLVTVINFFVPLISALFTTSYWYSSESFTELLLSQPVSRHRLFWSRIVAILSGLLVSIALGLLVPLAVSGMADSGSVWLFGAASFLTVVFCAIGALIATWANERMWGVGLAIGVWFYAIFIHDAIILSVLIQYRDYPLDTVSAGLCALNPIGLGRLALLMHFDAPLLLGHSGAVIRHLVETPAGYWVLVPIVLFWVFTPMLLAWRRFVKQDF